MKLLLAIGMLMLLICSVYQFWIHDLQGFIATATIFLAIRYTLQQIKNDHSQSE